MSRFNQRHEFAVPRLPLGVRAHIVHCRFERAEILPRVFKYERVEWTSQIDVGVVLDQPRCFESFETIQS